MDFNAVVADELAKMVDSGKVRELVAKHLEKTIEGVIVESLRPYGDMGKALTKKVEEAIGIELIKVNLQTAMLGMGHLVEGAVNRYVTEQTHPVLTKRLEEIFKAPPKTIALQELIDAYKEDKADDTNRDDAECIGLLIEIEGDKNLSIGLNPAPHKRDISSYSSSKKSITKVNDCEIHLHMQKSDGGYSLQFIWFGGYASKSTKDFLPTAMYGFARRLFQMYAGGTIVIVPDTDPDDYDTYYSHND